MSKPDGAMRMKHGMLMSKVAVEDALITLGNLLAEADCGETEKIWTYASVARIEFWSASHTLELFGIPLRVRPSLEEDEWVLTSIGLTRNGDIVKREIWSSGSGV